MSIKQILCSPVGLRLKVLHVVRIVIAAIGRIFFSLYYGNEGQKIPPITDEILKEPTIEVAKKIRNKEGGKGLLVMETENPIASNIPNQVDLLAVLPGNYHG